MHISRLKKKNHIILIVTKKAFDKIQYLFIVKIPRKKLEGNLLNLIKTTLTTLIQYPAGSSSHCSKARKRNKRHTDKGRNKTVPICKRHYYL